MARIALTLLLTFAALASAFAFIPAASKPGPLRPLGTRAKSPPDISIPPLALSQSRLHLAKPTAGEPENKPETKYAIGWAVLLAAIIYDKFFSGMH